MNQNNGTIGVIALYLLFIWLISAAGGAWLTERKGYGERDDKAERVVAQHGGPQE